VPWGKCKPGPPAARRPRRWIASADTPDGPSLGLGKGAVEAVEQALEPFAGIVDELLASLPRSALA
jgi:hypothetical protein